MLLVALRPLLLAFWSLRSTQNAKKTKLRLLDAPLIASMYAQCALAAIVTSMPSTAFSEETLKKKTARTTIESYQRPLVLAPSLKTASGPNMRNVHEASGPSNHGSSFRQQPKQASETHKRDFDTLSATSGYSFWGALCLSPF